MGKQTWVSVALCAADEGSRTFSEHITEGDVWGREEKELKPECHKPRWLCQGLLEEGAMGRGILTLVFVMLGLICPKNNQY